MRCENRVRLKGYLGADPEVRHLDGGKLVATFNVATTSKWKNKAGEWKEHTEWHRIVAWRWLAERAEEQLKRGTYCQIEGELKTRFYMKDEHKVYVTEIVATDLYSLERRPKKGGGATDSDDEGPPAGVATGTLNEDGSVTPDDEDSLPF